MVSPLTPSPAPSTPVAATGSNWISGPASGTSGTVSALDYAYYEQTAEWDYARKPDWANSWKDATYGVNLQQVSAVQNINGTRLHVNAKFKTRCKKLKQLPAGGSYTQMQKFSIFTVATDQYGFSYGDVPDPSAGVVFGPRGKVYTTQPWIWQLPWDDARDTEYNVVTQGTANAYYMSSCQGHDYMSNGDNLGLPMDVFLNDGFEPPQWGRKGMHSDPYMTLGTDTYYMGGGGYALSSEIGFTSSSLGLQRMEQFIEQNCGAVDDAQYVRRLCVGFPTNSNGFDVVQDADRVPVNSYYDSSRHDYS